MRFTVRHIATRFALILALAAVVPLLAYGVVSLLSLQRGTRESVSAGNLNVAARAAEEINRYITGHAEILKALASNLQDTGLAPWQQEGIIRNHVLQFREFREITLFDEAGQVVATSRVGAPRVQVPPASASPANIDGVRMSPIRVDEDLLPTATFAVRLLRLNQPAGWLVGEFSLEEMWRMVDDIRIGAEGFALVLAPDGTLLAHGDPDKKALVAQSANLAGHPLLRSTPAPDLASAITEYVDGDGREQLAAAARIEPLGWTVLVEQTTREAYASATRLQRQLVVTIAAALVAMLGVGLLFGRRFIAPIFVLRRGTEAVAAGDLSARVHIDSEDEFGDLGNAFNAMADRLVELQEDVKRQERQAMFGRIAAGLFHDLSHPIQNLGNSARLLMRPDLDQESRLTFQRTVDRELETLRRFMDDLRNIAKPKPIERFDVEVNSSVGEAVESMRAEAERHALTLEATYADAPLTIVGDRFALARVYRNLLSNAIQATAPGGRVSVTTARVDEFVEITVADTGSGIAPERIAAIFDDFVTTKRRGLGLGLAISKRIVEQLDGTIAVRSELGQGTTFTLRFPAREDRTVQAAAS